MSKLVWIVSKRPNVKKTEFKTLSCRAYHLFLFFSVLREGRRRGVCISPSNKIILTLCHQMSISSTFYVQIFCTNVVFLVTFWLYQKIRAFNVDEIDGRCLRLYHVFHRILVWRGIILKNLNLKFKVIWNHLKRYQNAKNCTHFNSSFENNIYT